MGILGILGGFISCLLTPVMVIGFILLAVSWFIAVKEAVDLELVPTIVTVVIGWVVILLFQFITSWIVAALIG